MVQLLILEAKILLRLNLCYLRLILKPILRYISSIGIDLLESLVELVSIGQASLLALLSALGA